MPTIRQLIQTSPAKATELFTKLAETSGNAVKTRERLFSELKEELELQMRLEEQHLFPVLRKRKETKDLVSDALNDNKETRKALTELERTPKESEAFASKVAELRKAFQQHVRDERKEFLPAVLKALRRPALSIAPPPKQARRSSTARLGVPPATCRRSSPNRDGACTRRRRSASTTSRPSGRPTTAIAPCAVEHGQDPQGRRLS